MPGHSGHRSGFEFGEPRIPPRRVVAAFAALLASTALAPAPALGDGGAQAMKDMAKQPARVLAQQAIAQLRLLGARREALERVDAAVRSRDQRDIDIALLRRADRALEAGGSERAVSLLDRALSRPLGAASGKELHASGREFRPARGGQELVGIVLGALLLGAGALITLRLRRAGSSLPGPAAPTVVE